MLARDLQRCAELVASHPIEGKRYGKLAGHLASAWNRCLLEHSIITAVVEDMDSGKPLLQGFGVSAFVTDAFMHSCKEPTIRWIGPELVRWLERGESPILGPKLIRDANSSFGLNLVSWVSILSPRIQGARDQVQIELMAAFMELHLGFKLKEVIGQQNEPKMMEVVSNSGGFFWHAAQGQYVEARNFDAHAALRQPFILGATPQTAQAHLSWITTLFQYTQPRIFFRPAEQKLLQAAMNGLKDEELSGDLGVSLSFVKKTWSAIYNRAVKTVPELQLDIATESTPQRGREKKHRVLSYVREHPEELRPVSPSGLAS